MNQDQKSRLLFDMEVRLWLVATYQKKVYRMLEVGIPLSNPKLIRTYRKLERLLDQITEIRENLEKFTGEKIFIMLAGINSI